MSKRKIQNRAETLKSFGVTTLLKLAQLAAESNHDGAFTILSSGDQFKAVFGQGAPSQAETLPAYDSLKGALVALLVESPTFADASPARLRGAAL
jgi:hypothetical protein